MKDIFKQFHINFQKLLTNKFFAIFVYAISAYTILSYFINGQLKSISFFFLVFILFCCMEDKMPSFTHFNYELTTILFWTILITAAFTTPSYFTRILNISPFREGMENATDTTTTTTDTTNTTTTTTEDDVDDDNGTLGKLDGEHNRIVNIAKRAKNSKEAKAIVEKLKESRPKPPPPTDESGDVVPLDSTTESTETEAEATVSAMSNMAGGKQTKGSGLSGNKGPRIDYAATLTDAYSNLNKILGQKGIEGLTNETKQLMSQQQALMSQMEGMLPFVQNAQKMLQGLNVDGLLAGAGKK